MQSYYGNSDHEKVVGASPRVRPSLVRNGIYRQEGTRAVTPLRLRCVLLHGLIILCIVALAGCANPVNTNRTVNLANAFPPSTPLVCPNDGGSGPQNSFVQHAGTQFVYNNNALKFYGFTFYPTSIGGSSAWQHANFTQYIDHVLTIGAQAGQNLLRPTDFWDKQYHDDPQKDAIVWQNVDYLVCAAKQRGMFVEMDVSAFSLFLISQHDDPFNASYWQAFLTAVAKHYSNQTSIAFYSVLGEPDAPKTLAASNKLIAFYRSVTDDLRAADSNHLIMAGGFNHMEDEKPDAPWWHQIYALPNNDIVGFKTYSQDDLNLMPTIGAYAQQLGKPLVDEEFGMPQSQGDANSTGITYNGLQIGRAAFFNAVYATGAANNVAGFIFWNLGCTLGDTHYEVSPATPAVWQVIKQYGPAKGAATEAQQTCPL
jgi:hypothetical protein